MARLAAIALTVLLVQGAPAANSQPLPSDFREPTDSFWAPPWVLDQHGSAVPALHNSMQQLRNGPLSVRLDDGSRGALRLESKPCEDGDDCEPFDCGCPLEYESYSLEVVDSRGERVARMHLWAAYGVFDVVPVDLVDGPADELIIVRIPAHASPPTGHDVKIWKLGEPRPSELVEPFKIAGLFDTEPIGCARWRTRLFVDLSASKPRELTLRSDFAAAPPRSGRSAVCRLDEQARKRHAALAHGQVLRFERGQY